MERARILRQRLEQQTARIQQLEEDAHSRETARIVRPLFEAYLPSLVKALGASSVQHETAIPTAKIEGDRRSVLVEIPVRDHVTTKAFSLPPLLGLFILTIKAQSITLDLITKLYRHRGKYEGDVATGQWLPPGEFLESSTVAHTEWHDPNDLMPSFIQFSSAINTQIPAIQEQLQNAERNNRQRTWWQGSQRALSNLAIGLMIAFMVFLLVWCVMSFMIMAKQGMPLLPR